MTWYKRFFLAATLLSGCAALHAKVEMPSFFSDNMVLQQKAKVALWGTATGKKVTVSSPEVRNPVAVRYCFRAWGQGSLYNSNGIPLLPFRTDDWDDLSK